MAIWNHLISLLDKAILQWVFPPICIHCKEPPEQNRYFCNECVALIDDCFLYGENIQLSQYLGAKKICIAFENIGPLYQLGKEAHPIYRKLFTEFVKLAYLQSSVFGCNEILYWNSKTHFPPIAYIANRMGLAFSLSVYNLKKVKIKLSSPLLLCWQFPSKEEYKKLEKILSKKILGTINILIIFREGI